MRTLLTLFILCTPLSIFSQNIKPKEWVIDSVNETSYNIRILNDTTMMLAMTYKMEFSFEKVVVTDSLERDSAKNNLQTVSIKKHIDIIKERFKTNEFKRDSTLKALYLSPIPDFDAPDTSGFVHRPMQYRGRVLFLHFFQFWDNSFENEIPVLNKLIDTYHKDGFDILSFVDIYFSDTERRVLREKPVHFPLVINARTFTKQFLPLRTSIPYIVLVDKMGRFRYFYINNELIAEKRTVQKDGSVLREKINTDFGLGEKIKALLQE
jgi:hypothetical protein